MSKKCTFVHPEGHPKAGEQCAAWEVPGTGFCYLHSPGVDPSELARKGGEAGRYKWARAQLEDEDKKDEWIIAQMEAAVATANDMRASPEALRIKVGALEAMDRARERQSKRNANIMRIEVEFVNDWRQES